MLDLQAAVVSALSALCEEYYQDETGQVDTQMQGRFIVFFCATQAILNMNTWVF